MAEEKKKGYAEPVPVDLEAYRASLPKPAGEAVVGTGHTDVVKLSAIVYRNEKSRRSLSVHHLQRRLFELGFVDAGDDRDGWYGDSTQKAIINFKTSRNLANPAVLDIETLNSIFDGDPNVTVMP
jgi:peptidoglycan hydrolase-like protein with peptidoglycan-binding domain